MIVLAPLRHRRRLGGSFDAHRVCPPRRCSIVREMCFQLTLGSGSQTVGLRPWFGSDNTFSLCNTWNALRLSSRDIGPRRSPDNPCSGELSLSREGPDLDNRALRAFRRGARPGRSCTCIPYPPIPCSIWGSLTTREPPTRTCHRAGPSRRSISANALRRIRPCPRGPKARTVSPTPSPRRSCGARQPSGGPSRHRQGSGYTYELFWHGPSAQDVQQHGAGGRASPKPTRNRSHPDALGAWRRELGSNGRLGGDSLLPGGLLCPSANAKLGTVPGEFATIARRGDRRPTPRMGNRIRPLLPPGVNSTHSPDQNRTPGS